MGGQSGPWHLPVVHGAAGEAAEAEGLAERAGLAGLTMKPMLAYAVLACEMWTWRATTQAASRSDGSQAMAPRFDGSIVFDGGKVPGRFFDRSGRRGGEAGRFWAVIGGLHVGAVAAVSDHGEWRMANGDEAGRMDRRNRTNDMKTNEQYVSGCQPASV